MSMAILNVQVPLPQHSVEVKVVVGVVHELNGCTSPLGHQHHCSDIPPLCFRNFWMVVEVTPSVLKDDHQGRKRSIL